MVFWDVKLCSDVIGYQCFRGLCSLHHHGEVTSKPRGWWLEWRRDFSVICEQISFYFSEVHWGRRSPDFLFSIMINDRGQWPYHTLILRLFNYVVSTAQVTYGPMTWSHDYEWLICNDLEGCGRSLFQGIIWEFWRGWGKRWSISQYKCWSSNFEHYIYRNLWGSYYIN